MPNVKKPDEINEEFHDRAVEDKLFDDYQPVTISSRTYEQVKVSNDKTTIILIDKIQRDTLSIVVGEFNQHHGKEYFEIKYTWSKNKRNGFLIYLFEILVYDMNFIVLSDEVHTSPGSKDFWASHIRRNKFKIFRYNIETNDKRNAKRFRENQIWGLTTGELEKMEAEKNNFQSYPELKNVILDEDISQEMKNLDLSEIDEDSLLSEFEYQIEEDNTQINEYKIFVAKYRKLIKSKENIRLIAQKK